MRPDGQALSWRAVQVDVYEEGADGAEQGYERESATRFVAQGPRPSSTADVARVNTPEPVSCQLTGKTGMGASTKNWLAAVARRIAFHVTGPTNAPTRAGRRSVCRVTPPDL